MNKNPIIKSFLTYSIIFVVCGLSLCLIQEKKTPIVNAETTEVAMSDEQITLNFIANIAETARRIGQERGLYASVMIAQAILESDSGQSKLSQSPYYNYFGIKGDYNGNSVMMPTWEDDGKGNTSEVDAAFRSYGSTNDSLEDYASLLSLDLYSGAWKVNTTSYTDATATLTGLYATDTSYGDKLNYLIDYYGLTSYDNPLTNDSNSSSNYVWNTYRGAYTDATTLAGDEAWASYTN